jgi:hypothetical protein
MRILGMTLWPEKTSDEQYIEQVRKRLKQGRRLRYFIAAFGLTMVGIAIWLIYMTIAFLKDFSNVKPLVGHHLPPPSQENIHGAYFIAVLMGGFMGFLLYQQLFHIAAAFFDFRKDKLLVECWDSLSDAEKGRLRQRSS